jgi:hypothetical protein
VAFSFFAGVWISFWYCRFFSFGLCSIVFAEFGFGVPESGLHSEARAGVGVGLTAILAPISGSSEPRAGVGRGLTEIRAPISSQLSTVGSVAADFGDDTELATLREVTVEDPQESSEESKPLPSKYIES